MLAWERLDSLSMIHAGLRHKPQEPINHSTWSRFVFQATESLARGEYLPAAPWRNIHTSLRGWSHPSLRGYSSMSLEYPKLNTWTEANLGKFLIPLLDEGLFCFSFSTKVPSLFLLYEGLPVGLLIPSLRRSLLFSFSMKVHLCDCSFLLYEGLAMGSEKISCGPKSFHGIIPCYPSAEHNPSTG
jgi:hypothetical protein